MCVSQGALALESNHELDYANASYTTTDIDAALSITGTVVAKVRTLLRTPGMLLVVFARE